MEKIDFTFSLSDEQKKLKEKLYQEILKDPHVISFMDENKLDKTYIYDHCGKVNDWIKQCEMCDRCAGLVFCGTAIQGHFLNLTMDDEIMMERMQKCRYQLKKEEMYAHRKNYLDFDTKESNLTISLEFNPAQESKEYMGAVDTALDFVSNPVKGLYIFGQPGVGKTYLMAAITNQLAKKGNTISFVNVPKYLSELKMLFKDGDAFDRKIRSVKKVDFLVLDDIGGESVTAWSRDEILLPLLDERMEKGKITLFTSNYSMNELLVRLSVTNNTMNEPMAAKRLLDRIKALSSEVFIKGNSRRK